MAVHRYEISLQVLKNHKPVKYFLQHKKRNFYLQATM